MPHCGKLKDSKLMVFLSTLTLEGFPTPNAISVGGRTQVAAAHMTIYIPAHLLELILETS